MGVEFIVCQLCQETFPDCGEFFPCDCGAKFCSTDCAAAEYEDDGDKRTCKYCRYEEATDYQIVEALLKHFNLTREQALDIHFNRTALVEEQIFKGIENEHKE